MPFIGSKTYTPVASVVYGILAVNSSVTQIEEKSNGPQFL